MVLIRKLSIWQQYLEIVIHFVVDEMESKFNVLNVGSSE